MKDLSKTILLCVLLVIGQSMYNSGTSVTILTAKDFDKVKTGIWLVQFYAQWCGHCQNLAPEYQKAAKALKGIANIAAINADKEKVNVQISGFPTIKFFVNGVQSDYNGDRTANGMIDFVLQNYKKIAYDRIGSKSSSSKGESSTPNEDEKDVVILTDDNFDELVLGDSKQAWFVQFYAPWCGHCKNLAPEWAALATNLKGEVKVGKVDATVHKNVASRFGVSGYPTIKFFPQGAKDESSAIDYSLARSESAMADWARQQTQSSGNFDQLQLTSQSVYDENCKGKSLCIISFLPHLLDSSQEERDRYFQQIKTAALNFRGKPFKFLWSQGGDHFDFQEKLGTIGVGYPIVLAIFDSKKVFGKMNRALNSQNLGKFLKEILENKAKFSKLVELPPLKTIEKKGCGSDSCNQQFESEL